MSFLDEYNYDLPEELIAHEPVEPRDSARLFVYHTDRDEVEFRTVSDLPTLLPNAHFVVNDTKVLPARLQGVGSDGKPVELLVLVDQGFGVQGEVRALVNRYTPIGEVIVVDDSTFTVIENKEKSMVMRFSGGEDQLRALLLRQGETPLPPYINSPVDEADRRTQYQTTFAKESPSVAAPTASLHFTPELLMSLIATGVIVSPVTLQVGLGTFAPIFADNFENDSLHTEYFSISATTATAITKSKAVGEPVVAVGTTVMRALESGKVSIKDGEGIAGATDIFIYPPYTFSVPDALMTNFHVPKSSLMCLVEAFLQHKGARRSLVELYQIAIGERFRFYSFGDSMLIL